MEIPFQCTVTDYREANAGHATWTALETKVDKVRAVVSQAAVLVCFMIFLGGMLAADYGAPTYWRVARAPALATVVGTPALLVAHSASVLLSNRRGRPEVKEIVELPPSQAPGKRHRRAKAVRAALFGAFCFMLTFVLALTGGFGGLGPSPMASTARPVREVAMSPFAWTMLFTMPLFVTASVLAAIQRRAQVRATTRGNPRFFAPSQFQFDEEGVTFHDPNGHVRLRWPGVLRFVETENLFMLYPAESMFHLVPKRDLVAAGQMDCFVVTLTQRVTTGVLIKRPVVGFPVQPLAAAVLPAPPLPPPPPLVPPAG